MLKLRKSRFNFRGNVDYDLALLNQVKMLNPFGALGNQGAAIWNQIAQNLQNSSLKMDVSARTCRHRTVLLMEKMQGGANQTTNQAHVTQHSRASELEGGNEIKWSTPLIDISQEREDAGETDGDPFESIDAIVPQDSPSKSFTNTSINAADRPDPSAAGFSSTSNINNSCTTQQDSRAAASNAFPIFLAVPELFANQQNHNFMSQPSGSIIETNQIQGKLNLLSEQIKNIESQVTSLVKLANKHDGEHREILYELRRRNNKKPLNQHVMKKRRPTSAFSSKSPVIPAAKNMPFVLLHRLPPRPTLTKYRTRSTMHAEENLCDSEEDNQSSPQMTCNDDDDVEFSIEDELELDQDYPSPLSAAAHHDGPLLNIKVEVNENEECDSSLTVTTAPAEAESRIGSSLPISFPCSSCPDVYSSAKELTKHSLIHSIIQNADSIGIKCSASSNPSGTGTRRTPRPQPLKHQKLKMEKTNKLLTEVGLAYRSRTKRLLSMAKTRTQSVKITCEECGENFKDTRNLKVHQLLSHQQHEKKQIKYKCPTCAKLFKSSGSLQQHHRQVHQQIKEHLCTTCGAAFARLDTLKRHLTLHTGEKPYHCKYCDSSFAQEPGLRSHQQLHFVNKNGQPQCTQCGQLFTKDVNLKKHIKYVHEKIRAYKCPICSKAFKVKTHLNYHIRTHTNPNSRQRGLNRDQIEQSSDSVVKIKRVGGISRIKQVAEEIPDD